MNENVNQNAGLNFAPANQSTSNILFEENGTFCKVGSEESGMLEVDLQIMKQKGVEIRSVSFAIPLGVDEQQNPIKAEMFFLDEATFNKFKSFIAKLNWND